MRSGVPLTAAGRRIEAHAQHRVALGDVQPAVAIGEAVRALEVVEQDARAAGDAVAVGVALDEQDLALPRRADQQVARVGEQQHAGVLDAVGVGVDGEAGRQRDAPAAARLAAADRR